MVHDELALDLDKLQAFAAVARLGSVGAAARALGRSQPAISHRLRSLQQALGVPLLERVGRGVQLTAPGRALAARCDALFTLAREAQAEAVSWKGAVGGVVRVGTYATVTSYLMATPMTALLAAHPGLTLRMVHGIGGPLLTRLRAGELDVVAVAGEVSGEGLEVTPIGQDRMAVVAAPALARAASASPQGRLALKAARYLAWGDGDDASFAAVHDFARGAGWLDSAAVSIPHIETLRRLAMQGAGFTVLPRYVVAEDLAAGRLAEVAAPDLVVPIHFVRVTRVGCLQTPAIRVVWELLDAMALERMPG